MARLAARRPSGTENESGVPGSRAPAVPGATGCLWLFNANYI